MSVGVLIAVTGKLEPLLVRALTNHRGEVSVVRRCGDVGELLAAAAAGIGGIGVLDASGGDVSAQVVADLARHGVRALLLAHPDDVERTAALGAAATLPLDTPPAEIAERIAELAHRGEEPEPEAEAAAMPPPPPSPTRRQLRAEAKVGREARIIAVWGPPGSHGRSSLAAALAHALVRYGRVLLIDADLAAPSLTPRLGILDDVSGLATLSRRANQGRLDEEVLAGAVIASHGFDLVTGIGRADRWRDISTATIEPILALAREHYDAIVIDVESVPWPAADGYDQFGAQPGAVREEILAAADDVLVVAQADTVSIARLITHVQSHPVTEREHVVVTAVRNAAAGSDAARSVLEVLSRFTSVERATLISDERKALDAALLAGAPITQSAPHCAMSLVVGELASELMGTAAPARPSVLKRLAATFSRSAAT